MELFIALLSLALLSCWGQVKAAEGFDSALDSLACSWEVEYSPGIIVDIKKSIENGAVLLEGRLETNKESCTSHCCATEDCNLAVFNTNSISVRGNNCYLVACGSPSRCELVTLESFVSMTFKKPPHSLEGVGMYVGM